MKQGVNFYFQAYVTVDGDTFLHNERLIKLETVLRLNGRTK
jgi:hypothetical protein